MPSITTHLIEKSAIIQKLTYLVVGLEDLQIPGVRKVNTGKYH